MIEVVNFSKSFGKKIVHTNINFHVRKGECLGLIGGSGTGKSVILRSLIGLEIPDTGNVIVNNQEINRLSEKELTLIRQKVSYVFQGGALFDSLNVFDNLAYSLKEHTLLSAKEIAQKIEATLAQFGLFDCTHLMPSQLSGGMQKRVGLARAMVLDPEVLLYDEPTAGLDPFNTRRIQDLILRLKGTGVTSILVTHDMPVALQVCDRLALVLRGEIVEEITPAQFHQSPNALMNRFIHGETF
jgi:phospholipid/cholesterol/gamma-HCH transport system ATP-binding protein